MSALKTAAASGSSCLVATHNEEDRGSPRDRSSDGERPARFDVVAEILPKEINTARTARARWISDRRYDRRAANQPRSSIRRESAPKKYDSGPVSAIKARITGVTMQLTSSTALPVQTSGFCAEFRFPARSTLVRPSNSSATCHSPRSCSPASARAVRASALQRRTSSPAGSSSASG